jgi:sulfatase maturation enzyme AslB (radical SAM superfamily)
MAKSNDYEIILTDGCNRQCSFCYINKTNYIESEKNVNIFVDNVLKYQKNSPDKFNIYMFGGEPLLNYPGVKIIYNRLIDDLRCNLHIITNGDMIKKHMIDEINQCFLHLSTYDIFDKKSWDDYNWKYHGFQKSVCLYTLTEDSLFKYNELKDIYNHLGFEHHIHFSHDPNSWKTISCDKLYLTIYEIFKHELLCYADGFSNSNRYASNFIELYLSRYVQMLFDSNMQKSFCVNETKKTFYMGKFIGSCIRLKNKKIEYTGTKCSKCVYDKCCTSGCNAELTPEVNDKLCIIEKAKFDSIRDFVKSGHPKLERIIHTYYEKIFETV